MRIRHDREVDLSKLGAALIQGAAIIFAIRTARREAAIPDPHCSNRDVSEEVEYAVEMSSQIIAAAVSRHPDLFEQAAVEFTTGVVQGDVQL